MESMLHCTSGITETVIIELMRQRKSVSILLT